MNCLDKFRFETEFLLGTMDIFLSLLCQVIQNLLEFLAWTIFMMELFDLTWLVIFKTHGLSSSTKFYDFSNGDTIFTILSCMVFMLGWIMTKPIQQKVSIHDYLTITAALLADT